MQDDDRPRSRGGQKTVMRLMSQGDRAKKKEEVEKKAREEEEPVCQLIPMSTARKLSQICSALAQELPQGESEIRMARLRAPKSSTGAALRDGASVNQAATHAALKALEQWVRMLRPFASSGSHNLAMLVARIVHIQDDQQLWKQAATQRLSEKQAQNFVADQTSGPGGPPPQEQVHFVVIPPESEPLGAAIRRIVPTPDSLQHVGWEWLEDLLSALEYEESFDRTSFVHRSSTPNSTMRRTGSNLVSEMARPNTTGRIEMPMRRPLSKAAKRNLSGWRTWDSFQADDGFRACTTSFNTEKYHRSIPGPAVYCDYDKKLGLPQNAARGVYPSVGDRRTPCITTNLAQLDRFFQQDFRVE